MKRKKARHISIFPNHVSIETENPTTQEKEEEEEGKNNFFRAISSRGGEGFFFCAPTCTREIHVEDDDFPTVRFSRRREKSQGSQPASQSKSAAAQCTLITKLNGVFCRRSTIEDTVPDSQSTISNK